VILIPSYYQSQRTGHLVAEWNDLVAEDERIAKMGTQEVMTSSRKRPADFANDEEHDLKRRHKDGILGTVSSTSMFLLHY
jgi:hypothetical protein